MINWALLAFALFLATTVDTRYLPYCNKTQIPDYLIEEGVIHIVYSMKSRCRQCYTLALMLPLLKEQLAIDEGISVNLIIAMDKVQNKDIKPLQILPNVKIDTSGVIYNKLGNNNGFLFIIDRCRRLTYRVVPEHAIKFKPYVWATILSTFVSNPCGHCEFSGIESSSKNPEISQTEVPESSEVFNSTEDEDQKHLMKLFTGYEDKESSTERTATDLLLEFISFLVSVFDIKSEKTTNQEIDKSLEYGSEETSEEKEKLKEHYGKLIPWIYIASQ